MKNLKCPVCSKPLSQTEYDKALGLWKDKQEHIRHLEDERQKLKAKEQRYKEKMHLLAETAKNQQQQMRREMRQQLTKQAQESARRLAEQRLKLETIYGQRLKAEISRGVEQGIKERRREFDKQSADLRKAQSKMTQLENSLKLSAGKYAQANEEIKRLREQIEKGITPQIEGLLEESILLAKLRELFPLDKFEHPGKGGDIIQVVIQEGKAIGRIVYECKKVKHFDRKHIMQVRVARQQRSADFAVLVTNTFPSKKQYYFVEQSIFVISPLCFEPITYMLRDSLLKIAVLKLTNEAKEKAVQKVYDYLSSYGYNNKVNDVTNQLFELRKELKTEMTFHKRIWERRYDAYGDIFSDIQVIDYNLKALVQNQSSPSQKLLVPPKRALLEIKELEKQV